MTRLCGPRTVASRLFSQRETSKPSQMHGDGGETCLTSTRTGFSQHGDYVFGWKGNSLQTAMDSSCYLRNCTQLTSQTPKVKNECNVPVTVNEQVDGCEFLLLVE